MPDGVASFMHGEDHYFVTANEGAIRDADDTLIGGAGRFDGERIRLNYLYSQCTCQVPRPERLSTCPSYTWPPRPMAAPVPHQDCCANRELGRLWTTVYQPSDYATNACGPSPGPNLSPASSCCEHASPASQATTCATRRSCRRACQLASSACTRTWTSARTTTTGRWAWTRARSRARRCASSQ